MKFDHTDDPKMFPEVYENYTYLGGGIPRTMFSDILQTFFDLTLEAYVHGIGSRENSMYSFRQHLKGLVNDPVVESNRIFRAVDSFGAYT